MNYSKNQTLFISFQQMNIIFTIRSLWLQLALWMRSYIISSARDSADLSAITNRLYQVPRDFYITLRVAFGRTLAEQFMTFLTRYIVAGALLLDSLKRGDQEAVNARTEQWYQIADEMARFLSQNPNWDESQWKTLFYQNISMTISQMLAELNGEYERGIAVFERINRQAVDMADYMLGGMLP